jgi:hypothetical protein
MQTYFLPGTGRFFAMLSDAMRLQAPQGLKVKYMPIKRGNNLPKNISA